jgi:hypothetical protein
MDVDGREECCYDSLTTSGTVKLGHMIAVLPASHSPSCHFRERQEALI